jgi:hypothetical protein
VRTPHAERAPLRAAPTSEAIAHNRNSQSLAPPSIRKGNGGTPVSNNRRSWAWRSLDVEERWELSLELGPVHPTLGTPCIYFTPGPGRYGRIGHDGTYDYSHRYAYSRDVGPIPSEFEVSHLCGHTRCVNALGGHLVVEPGFLNQQRYVLQYRAETEAACLHGHPRSETNTYVAPDGQRRCRTCQTLARQGLSLDTPIEDVLVLGRGRPVAHPDIDGRKVCLCCLQPKLLGEFGKDSRRKSGLSGTCKGCKRKRQTTWRRKARTAPRRVRGPVHPVRRGKKVCLKCEITKPVACFYADKRRKDGLLPLCKSCEGKRQAAWRASHSSFTKVA